MIISASYRTDIPAFYGRWFLARLAAGYCRVASPYGGPPYRVALDAGAVDGFVFWTRNVAPFMAALREVKDRRQPFMVQFTATGYPRSLERSVIATREALAQMQALARDFGPRAVVWRYDPVVFTSLTPADWHARTFAGLAARLRGVCDEVVVSFAQIYAKTRRRLTRAARDHGFTWRDPPDDEKTALLKQLAGIAAAHDMTLSLCAQPGLLIPGVRAARCIDAVRLSDIAGRPITAPVKGNRPGCECARSRDIGSYDSCAQGCVYCYAVSSAAGAAQAVCRHDPGRDMLALPDTENRRCETRRGGSTGR